MTDGLFSLLNYNHNDSSIITIRTVTEANGATHIDGYIAPFEGSQQNAEASLSSSLLLGIPGVDYIVKDISVGSTTVEGTSEKNPTFYVSNYSYTLYGMSKTSLYDISYSPVDYRLIQSSRVENLELSQENSSTILTLNVYNRHVSGNRSQYNLTLNGSWEHIVSSNKSLSCSVLYSMATTQLAFVWFTGSALVKIGEISPSSFIPSFNSTWYLYYLHKIEVA